MAEASTNLVTEKARYVEEGERYWCEPCSEFHPGAGPEYRGEGYYIGSSENGLTNVVGDETDSRGYIYVLTAENSTMEVYQCKEGWFMDTEDWWSNTALWECTVCTGEYTVEDYGDDAKEMAEDCCTDKKDHLALQPAESGDFTFTIDGNAITTSANITVNAMAQVNEALKRAAEAIERANKPTVISAEDVTAEAFK